MQRMRGGPDLERIPVVPLVEQLRWQDIVQAETNPDALRMLSWWTNPRDVAPSSDQTMADTFRRLWKTDNQERQGN